MCNGAENHTCFGPPIMTLSLQSIPLHQPIPPPSAPQTAPDGWKNSVRHNLSLNKCFEKVENKMSGTSRKGCLWALNPAKIDKMEEEMQKWKRKDLAAIHRSMANPGRAGIGPQEAGFFGQEGMNCKKSFPWKRGGRNGSCSQNVPASSS